MKMSKNCNECPASWVCADEWEYGSVECKHFHIDAEMVFTSTDSESAQCDEDLCPECKGSDMSNKCTKCGMWF